MTKLVPAEIALSVPPGRREANKWPSRAKNSRLDPVALPILFPKFSIAQSDRVFTIGSCFARNIEEYLTVLGLDVPTVRFSAPASEAGGRPSGILNKYTPASMLQEIDRTIRLDAASEEERHKIFSECLIEADDGSILDMELSTTTGVTMERAVERRQQVYQLFRELHTSDLVIITFGLIESWWDAESKLYIQRVPTPRLIKKYPGRFFYKRIDFEEAIDSARQIVSKISGMGKAKRILATTSPVPMGRTFTQQDVLVANTYSKSLLRTVCEIIKDENENVDYYPSFEMVTMSKGADVWEDDLIHVSNQFVGRVVNRMIETYYGDPGSINPAQQAWSAIFARDFKGALEIVKQAPSTDPTLELVHGLSLTGLGNREEGLRLVSENCIQADLSNREAAYVSTILNTSDDSDSYAKFLDAFLKRDHDEDQHTAAMHARKALLLTGKGDRSGALASANLALQARESMAVLTMVGEAFCVLGEDQLAREHLQRVLKNVSKVPAQVMMRGNANACLAIIEGRAGNLASAMSALQKAKQDAPRSRLTRAAEKALQA